MVPLRLRLGRVEGSIRGLVPLLIVERFEGLQGCANGYRFYPPPHQPSPAARLLRLPLKGGVMRAVTLGLLHLLR